MSSGVWPGTRMSRGGRPRRGSATIVAGTMAAIVPEHCASFYGTEVPFANRRCRTGDGRGLCVKNGRDTATAGAVWFLRNRALCAISAIWSVLAIGPACPGGASSTSTSGPGAA